MGCLSGPKSNNEISLKYSWHYIDTPAAARTRKSLFLPLYIIHFDMPAVFNLYVTALGKVKLVFYIIIGKL